jgi:hypothetical protein
LRNDADYLRDGEERLLRGAPAPTGAEMPCRSAPGAAFEQFRGLTDYAAAVALNERGILTARGGRWQAIQVGRVRSRLAAAA